MYPSDDSPTSPVEPPPPAVPPPPPPAGFGSPPASAGGTPSPTPPPGFGSPPPGFGSPPPGFGSPPPGSPAPGSAQRSPAARSSGPENQPALVLGVLLLVVGLVLLATRVADMTLGADAWPLWIVVPGVAMLVASFFIPARGGLGLAVPGAIVAMVGAVLWVQDTYDAWQTWAYAWALVAPTGPGLGMLLYGLAKGDGDLARDGLRTTVVGLVLFGAFALFFEGILGLSGQPIANLDQVLPFGLIGLGIVLVVLSLFGGGSKRREERRLRREARRAR